MAPHTPHAPRPGGAVTLRDWWSRVPGPDMAPHPPHAPRPGGAVALRDWWSRVRGPEMARSTEMGGPEMAPHTAPAFAAARRSRSAALGSARLGSFDMAPTMEMGGHVGAPQPDNRRRSLGWRIPAYSRMVSNWNLQPTGVSAFTTLKPDMVS
jgi:hypothetical protein